MNDLKVSDRRTLLKAGAAADTMTAIPVLRQALMGFTQLRFLESVR